MLKFSVLLFATIYLVILVAGMVLWAAATATGLRENIENFIGELIASDDFEILGPVMFRASVLGGLVLVVMGTGVNVLLAVLYNLISDVIGGIIVVFEERPGRRRSAVPGEGREAVEPLRPRRGAQMAPPARRPAAGPPPPPNPERPQAAPEQVAPANLTRPAD